MLHVTKSFCIYILQRYIKQAVWNSAGLKMPTYAQFGVAGLCRQDYKSVYSGYDFCQPG